MLFGVLKELLKKFTVGLLRPFLDVFKVKHGLTGNLDIVMIKDGFVNTIPVLWFQDLVRQVGMWEVTGKSIKEVCQIFT